MIFSKNKKSTLAYANTTQKIQPKIQNVRQSEEIYQTLLDSLDLDQNKYITHLIQKAESKEVKKNLKQQNRQSENIIVKKQLFHEITNIAESDYAVKSIQQSARIQKRNSNSNCLLQEGYNKIWAKEQNKLMIDKMIKNQSQEKSQKSQKQVTNQIYTSKDILKNALAFQNQQKQNLNQSSHSKMNDQYNLIKIYENLICEINQLEADANDLNKYLDKKEKRIKKMEKNENELIFELQLSRIKLKRQQKLKERIKLIYIREKYKQQEKKSFQKSLEWPIFIEDL